MSKIIAITGRNRVFVKSIDDELLLTTLSRLPKKAITVGCRRGGCGVCKVKVVSGSVKVIQKMSRARVNERDVEKGFYLACSVVPISDLVVKLV